MIRFGTGGWRAVIGEDFTQENVRRVAAGILALMREEGRTDRPVVIGYDRRFLSEPAARWTAEVLAAGGVDVWFMNRSAPTPLAMFTVMNRGLHYGIEITASHNPARYDGVKLAADLEARFGAFRMAEDAIRFEDAARKAAVERLLLEEKKLPSLVDEIEHVGYEDGCKVYFKGGDWTLCRFSGTEPLLRVCAESSTEEKARSYVDAFRSFLGV